jgi:hypothetical protein
MVEMHEYDEKNANTCQYCKDNKEKYENEDAQVLDYHIITPKKRTGINASIADLSSGKNVRFKKGNYSSQLDALELATSSDENNSSSGSESGSGSNSSQYPAGVGATLADLYQGKNVKFKKGNYSSQLDALELATSSSSGTNKGGRKRRTKRTKKSMKRSKRRSIKRRSIKRRSIKRKSMKRRRY